MPYPISVPSFCSGLPYLAEPLMAPEWVFRVFSHSSHLKGNCRLHYVHANNKTCAQTCDIFLYPSTRCYSLISSCYSMWNSGCSSGAKIREREWLSPCLCVLVPLHGNWWAVGPLFCLVGVFWFVCGFFFEGCFLFESKETEVYMDFGYAYGLEVLKQQCHIYIMYGDTGSRADLSSTFQFASVDPVHSGKRQIIKSLLATVSEITLDCYR